MHQPQKGEQVNDEDKIKIMNNMAEDLELALVDERDQFKASASADSVNHHEKKQEGYKTETNQGLGGTTDNNNDIDHETSKEETATEVGNEEDQIQIRNKMIEDLERRLQDERSHAAHYEARANTAVANLHSSQKELKEIIQMQRTLLML
jgi:hypothetical protein